jgi:hypothetical protein
MEAWRAASGGALRLEKTDGRAQAHIRVHWVTGSDGLYGETRAIDVNGERGAEVYVLPAVVPPGEKDQLLRDAIVYLTCLHETGHALGLEHTANFADIMYSFQYGGNSRSISGDAAGCSSRGPISASIRECRQRTGRKWRSDSDRGAARIPLLLSHDREGVVHFFASHNRWRAALAVTS